MIIVDLDDFCEDNSATKEAIVMLFRLKDKIPEFKVNLFTIPGRCGQGFIEAARKLDWVDLIPHGMFHATSRECEHWTYEHSCLYLDWLSQYGWTKGFKSPGWQTSDGLFQALAERGYWVADQAYNNHRRPPELRAYILDEPHKIHGHIGHLGGHNANALELIYDDLLQLRGEFMFIKDLWLK